MADLAPVTVKNEFEVALKERNFDKRCHLLGDLGRKLKAANLASAQLEELLDGLADLMSDAFIEKARMIVAKKAGCLTYSKKLLDHSSQTVRYDAVKGLQTQDAREMFLSNGCGRKVKKWLTYCPELPCDDEVMKEADKLFGEQDKELVWAVLTRAKDEKVFKEWLSKLQSWVETEYTENALPGLPQLAKRFPDVVLELVLNGDICFKWYWVMPLLADHAEKILRAAFIADECTGSGPLRNKIHLDDALCSWGWRHKPDVMMQICREVAEKCGDLNDRDDGEWDVIKLVATLMEIKSTKFYITTNQKISMLVDVFVRVPDVKKTTENAFMFVELFPSGLKEHRTKEIQSMIDAFWKVAAEVGRSNRKELVVGDCLKTFLPKLPPPLAVQQFFRILDEFEADKDVYKFVQSTICKSSDGRHDALMHSVFERYLQKEDESAKKVVSMFQVLLEDALSMDIVQKSFDLLTERLGARSELGLLLSVVQRMGALEALSHSTSENRPPASTLPIPTDWVHFVVLPPATKPHIDHLHRILHSGTGENQPLGAMIKEYGVSFFWDAFEQVLRALTGKNDAAILECSSVKPPNTNVLEQIDFLGLAKPLPRSQAKPALSRGDSTLGTPAPGVYFESFAEVKKTTYGRDSSARLEGFMDMMHLAQQDKDRAAAFDDLLPFLVGRLNGETQEVRVAVVEEMLDKPAFPFDLWASKLDLLIKLYKVCAKTRSPLNETWNRVGAKLVRQALREWQDGAGPSAACTFGVEVAVLDLPGLFAEEYKSISAAKRPQDKSEPICQTAAQWVFESITSKSNSIDSAGLIQMFEALESMAKVVPRNEGAERALWQRWPFVEEKWKALLKEGVKQKGASFIMVQIVEKLCAKQDELQETLGEKTVPWWRPLECDEYKTAVAGILAQIESKEIPVAAGSDLLVKRVHAILEKETITLKKTGVPTMPSKGQACEWIVNRGWDIQKHERYIRLKCRPRRHSDSLVAPEVAVLQKLLASGHRQVLWQTVVVAAAVFGPMVVQLLRDAIASLDAKTEGMARCIARHYPYLCTALSWGEEQNGTSDVLTPLLELLLADDASRDASVQEIMRRNDFEYFLFFGTSFQKHLSVKRQELLHECLKKLRAPGEDGLWEFYHYKRRGLKLVRLANVGVKRYRIPVPRLRNQGSRKAEMLRRAREIKSAKLKNKMDNSADLQEPVQMYLWHPDTQVEFLQKALTSTILAESPGTKMVSLSLLPRLEYANGIPTVSTLLESYGTKDRSDDKKSGPVEKDTWGWEVIQIAGAYSNLSDEIQRRFQELPTPGVSGAVGDPEVQQLLVALGKADDAATALKVLGKYAGKVKQAKEAVVKMVRTLSPSQARMVIKDVMLDLKAGVALQVAGLRLMEDLQVGNQLELYRAAWCEGKCHRDVAGNILSKVATSAEAQWHPEDVRTFFNFFTISDREEDHSYVAELLLDQLLSCKKWSLPYLPEIVQQLTMMPGASSKALTVLLEARTYITEVIRVLTSLLKSISLAVKAENAVHPKAAANSREAQLLTDLAALGKKYQGTSATAADHVESMPLEESEPAVLREFVMTELSIMPDDSDRAQKLRPLLKVWSNLLRAGDVTRWPSIIKEMEDKLNKPTKLKGHGREAEYARLAEALQRHIVRLSEDPEMLGEEKDAAIAAICSFYEQLLDTHLLCPESGQADKIYRDLLKDKSQTAEKVLNNWAAVLICDCSEAEAARFFKRCTEALRNKLATTIIKGAVSKAKSRVDMGNGEKPGGENVPEVARWTLRWLSDPVEKRDTHLSSIIELWTSVVACEIEGSCGRTSFTPSLDLLGSSPLSPSQSVQLVETLLAEDKLALSVIREALEWLGKQSPSDAVRLWPTLLIQSARSNIAKVDVADVEALLDLCQTHDIDPPEIPPDVARKCNDTVLPLFAKHGMSQARIIALQILQLREHNLSAAAVAILDELCGDTVAIISVAAKHLKASLEGAGSGKKKSVAKKKGKGKGKGFKGEGKSSQVQSDSDDLSQADSDEEDEDEDENEDEDEDERSDEGW